MKRRPPFRRRLRNLLILTAAFAAVLAVSAPSVVSYAQAQYESWRINSASYKKANGHWTTITLPKNMRVNAVHSALLYTGDILVVAGSGNNPDAFKAGTFKTLLYNPATDSTQLIPTPKDLFCGGHAYLPDGNLLVAGGTRKYEVEAAQVTNAAGILTVKNDSLKAAITLAKGTHVLSQGGIEFITTEDVTVPAAHQMVMDGSEMTMAGENTVWVEAVKKGKSSIIKTEQSFTFMDTSADVASAVYGVSKSLTMQKQDFEGITASYIYDVQRKAYVKTSDLNFARWYPSLVSLNGGNVLAVSGLDQHGQILPGNNEIYDIKTGKWTENPALFRYFPTFPALFRLANGDLFYSGSNAGYGSATQGRTPGIWHLTNNTFTPTPGIRDAKDLETSGSVLLPPVQSQKVMVVGGGGVGDVTSSTARTAVIDLSQASVTGNNAVYQWTDGPSLPAKTRYPEVVSLPDDTVFISGGSSDYRGRSGTDLHQTLIYTPKTNTMRSVASNVIGRDYHSEALLLPDGRVVTLGGNPLFSDATNTQPGGFEQRIEIYSPPYLYNGEARPVIKSAPATASRGDTIHVDTPDGSRIATARLMRPSASTHVTDLEQRSVALSVAKTAGGVDLTLPKQEGLVPSGWYMLFLVSAKGTPSQAQWVQVR